MNMIDIDRELWSKFNAKCKKQSKKPNEVLEQKMRELLKNQKPITTYKSKIYKG